MEIGLTSLPSLELEAGQVDVWLTCLCNVCRDQEAETLQLLSEAERSKWRRFVAEDARLQYLVSRALVRTTLSRYARVPELAWQFQTNRYGRPSISQPQSYGDIQFNLSNTSGLVVCVVAKDCEIGVDVENAARPVDIDALAPAVFSPDELADVRSLQSEDKRYRFFSYWTLKEAYIKARAEGLSIPLDAFWFDLRGPSPVLRVTDRCLDEPTRWRFYQYAPTADHRLAIAVAAPRVARFSVRLHWITPTSPNAVPTRRCSRLAP